MTSIDIKGECFWLIKWELFWLISWTGTVLCLHRQNVAIPWPLAKRHQYICVSQSKLRSSHDLYSVYYSARSSSRLSFGPCINLHLLPWPKIVDAFRVVEAYVVLTLQSEWEKIFNVDLYSYTWGQFSSIFQEPYDYIRRILPRLFRIKHT